MISQKRDVNLETLFKFKLSPVPSSLFDEYGDMRKGNKSVLCNKLAVKLQDPDVPDVDLILTDGNEAIYHAPWPKLGTVKTFTDNFLSTLSDQVLSYVIFDKYVSNSIKSHERSRRAGGFSYHSHTLQRDTPLPKRDSVIKNEANKSQLINNICSMENVPQHIKLIGPDQCIFGHEEADVNIISYMLHLHDQYRHIQVVADDTDIFVLLLFFVWKVGIKSLVSMRKHDGTVINITETARKLKTKCLTLLPLHALTGCDTVSYPCGKGKATAINMLMKEDLHLEALLENNDAEAIYAGKNFISSLYGGMSGEDLDHLRYKIFSEKRDPPKIRNLPPTNEAAAHHIKRAHLQTLLWAAAEQQSPPKVDSTKFGWKKSGNTLIPVPGANAVAPPELLKVVACSCKSDTPCTSNRCSCNSSGVSCTSYCKCGGESLCQNKNTLKELALDDMEIEDE